MSKRIVGFMTAIVLALVGTVALVAYVNSAEQRALAGEELVEVYVVTSPIAAGTAAEEIESSVYVEQVPTKVRASGAVDSLVALAGKVAAVDLLPGEQLLNGRFVQRTELADREVGIEVPEEMVELTIQLEPERAVGGLLEPGQTVAVFASFGPSEVSQTTYEFNGELVAIPSAAAEEAGGSASSTTDLLFHKVLVTAVQEPSGRPPGQAQQRLTTPPGGPVFVTLALDSYDAERLVYTAESGTLWLAIERETVPDIDEPGQSRGSVLLDWAGTP